jgi:hypothetical protein
MAVSYVQQPVANSIQSSDTPLLFSFSSTQTAQANFSFVVDTLYNGVIVSTDMVFPERGSRAHFDASRIALALTKAPPRSFGYITTQALPTLQIRVSERYGAVPVTQPFVQSNVCKIAKASCNNEVFGDQWLPNKYTPSVKWLTDAPDTRMLVSRKYPVWASILNTDPQVQIEIHLYDLNDDIAWISTSGQLPGSDKVNFNLIPSEIEDEIFTEVGLLLTDISRMEVYMNQSQPLHIQYIDEDCGEFHQLNWLNNLGAYDQMLFTHNRESDSAVTALEYKKQFGAWDTLNKYQYDDLSSGDTTYVKEIQETGSLFSGWIPEAYQNWLSQIYQSVEVQLLEPTTTERIVVTDTKSSKLTHRFEDALNFQVNFKKSNFKSITQ